MAARLLASCFPPGRDRSGLEQQQQLPLLLDARNPLLPDEEATAARRDADADAPPCSNHKLSKRSPYSKRSKVPPAQVWLLAGQSNCTGWNGPDGTSLDPPQAPPDGRVLMLSADGEALVPAAEPTHLGVWGLDDRATVGPGLSFARALRAGGGGARGAEGPTVVLVPCARGGSSLCADWAPDAPDDGGGGGSGGGGGGGGGASTDRGGSLYGCCVRRARRAVELASLHQDRLGGPRPSLQGVVWVQGESDGADERGARAYGDNFAAFLGRLRADLSGAVGGGGAVLPVLPVVLMVVMASRGREGAFPYIRLVREEQLRIAAEAAEAEAAAARSEDGGGGEGGRFSGVAALDMAGYEFFPQPGDGQLVHLTKAGAAAMGTALGLLAAAAAAERRRH